MRTIIFIILLISAPVLRVAAQTPGEIPEILTGKRWNLRYEGLDANNNGRFDKGEKTEVDSREHVWYEFSPDGKGKYNNAAFDAAAALDITWVLADNNHEIIVIMKGATYRYHIQTITAKSLILNTKTVDGRGFEEYGGK